MTGIHQTGDVIGERYDVLSYIGEGGMQEVYLAADRLLSRSVALKAPKNSSATKRFQRSAVVSARVNHANVAKTLDYVETSERSYLIEELIQGEDLSAILKSRVRCLDPHMAARTLHHLAKGLAASHHAGVVHRDLKPSNVMVVGGANFHTLKITDFGIAKMAAEELADAVEGGESTITASQTAIGAIPYMAPEAIEDIRNVGQAADIWSLGAMMYELISGSKPFGTGYKAILAISKAEPLTLPAAIQEHVQFKALGEQLFALIQRCVSADPSTRPTADEIVHECEQLCYQNTDREFGTIRRFDNPAWGFISADKGKDVFFHAQSVFPSQKLKVGDRVWFARHQGGGSDRAFPVLKVARSGD